MNKSDGMTVRKHLAASKRFRKFPADFVLVLFHRPLAKSAETFNSHVSHRGLVGILQSIIALALILMANVTFSLENLPLLKTKEGMLCYFIR